MNKHEVFLMTNLVRIQAALEVLRGVSDYQPIEHQDLDHVVGQLVEWEEALKKELRPTVDAKSRLRPRPRKPSKKDQQVAEVDQPPPPPLES